MSELRDDNIEAVAADIKRRFSPRSKLFMSAVFIAADLLAVMCCFAFGFFIVRVFGVRLNTDWVINFKSFVTYWPYLPAFIVIFYVLHLYPGLSLPPAEELRRYTIASFFSHASIILALYIEVRKVDSYSLAFAISWLGSVPALFVARAAARAVFRGAPWWGTPAVIFGAGKTGRMITDRLLAHPAIGYVPAVLLDDDPRLAGEYRGVPILTGTDLGMTLAERGRIDTAIVAMPGVERGRLAAIIADSVRSFRHYVLIPDLFGMTSGWMSVRDIDGILGVSTTQRLLLPSSWRIKRILDILMTTLGGILALPFIGLLALLVKLDSPGPAFYGHHRLGKDGVPFKAWKFRSMIKDSGEVLENLLATDPGVKAEWEASFKLKNDPRVTLMGRFLRRTSLDELPQVWNVLRGEMSLIGPRPIIEAEVPKYGHYYKLFASVKPGMSGLWQVSGRSDTDYDERVALDVYYIQSWSLWLDMYILFKTVRVAVGGDGAY
jgi:Undecaprenyl-phosphate galactose phosphotransferase WbaP